MKVIKKSNVEIKVNEFFYLIFLSLQVNILFFSHICLISRHRKQRELSDTAKVMTGFVSN